ncbi:hypothetical protein Tco_0530460 [Tanacetum coccineum]
MLVCNLVNGTPDDRRDDEERGLISIGLTAYAKEKIHGKEIDLEEVIEATYGTGVALDLRKGRGVTDEEPVHGTLWVKGMVNKDEEYLDDEIRSVEAKLKETEDKIKEGTLKVDHGTNVMTVVLVSPVDINPINSSADEEGGTTVVGCMKTQPFRKS